DLFRTDNISSDSIQKLDDLEKNHIFNTLKDTGWRISGEEGAAKILGINPNTLRSKMQKLGIVKPR
ncbi:MAG: hypothetical protein GTN99_01085, partial [Candidatus Dadabacteria bacterium]|nr:hypothetical protein [Candidatus Dadabacteria bacterium]